MLTAPNFITFIYEIQKKDSFSRACNKLVMRDQEFNSSCPDNFSTIINIFGWNFRKIPRF